MPTYRTMLPFCPTGVAAGTHVVLMRRCGDVGGVWDVTRRSVGAVETGRPRARREALTERRSLGRRVRLLGLRRHAPERR